MPASAIRIGAVSYLNTKPLVHGLEKRLSELAKPAELAFDLPSRLADRLSAGELEVALIPSIEAFQDPTYSIISNACIGCRGPVLSVKLLCRKPAAEIRTLALDEGSRTSAALVRILLQERFGLTPEISSLPIGSGVADNNADAVLLIGDRAIHPTAGSFVETWDLGEVWREWSGLPFVFAMWTARAGVDLSDVEPALIAARDGGVAALSAIATDEAPGADLTHEQCLHYLRDNLHFYLGESERQGLALYYKHAAKLGLAPPDLNLRFMNDKTYKAESGLLS